LRFRGLGEPLPEIAIVELHGWLRWRFVVARSKAQRGRERGDEPSLMFSLLALGVVGLIGLVSPQAVLSVLEQPPGRKPAELLEKLGAEKGSRIGERRSPRAPRRLVLQPLGDDEPRLLGRSGLQQRDRPRLLDTVDIGLRQHTPDLAVKIFKTGDENDRGWNAVGDLNEVAHRFLESLFRIIEEAQVLDLVDAENQRRAVDSPHELAKRLDDLESAAIAAVRIECGHRRLGQLVELAALQILAHALVDAWVAALEIKQRPD